MNTPSRPRRSRSGAKLDLYVYRAPYDEGTWIVEAIDRYGDGDMEFATFSNQDAEERARRYCQLEYGRVGQDRP